VNLRLVLRSLTASLAGFLFGFDTVVISGAEKTIQALWGLSDELHGLAMGAALWGTVLGAFLGGWPTEKIGRKKTLIWTGLATDVYSFIIARFIGGLGVGVSTIAAPMYISEIAPARLRGRLAGLFQFNIVFGILAAFLSNALLAGTSEHDWRWMLGVEAIPALIYTILCFIIPESPRWLIGHAGNTVEGLRVLELINPDRSAAVLREEADVISASYAAYSKSSRFWTKKLRIPILLAFLIAFFNQLSGMPFFTLLLASSR
jgi:SP family arabinose:H+ symporter-like MFS transporter